MHTNCTFRADVGAHSAHTHFYCVVKPGTLNQHKHTARSYKRTQGSFIALFGYSSPYMGAVYGQRGMQGIWWQSRQLEGSKFAPSVRQKKTPYLSAALHSLWTSGSPHWPLAATTAGNAQASMQCMYVLCVHNSRLKGKFTKKLKYSHRSTQPHDDGISGELAWSTKRFLELDSKMELRHAPKQVK